MTAIDEQSYYSKLQAIRDIKGRTIQLDKLKNRIFREIENTDAEEKSLAEYRREMEMLLQEKMSHVEELRQIHADINAMETVIKQAEENRARSLNVANKIHEEYVPLKTEIDQMRHEYLGLSPIPDLHEEEGSIITAEYSTILQKLLDLRLKQSNTSHFSRFQSASSYYHPSSKLSSAHSALGGGGTPNFARPPLGAINSATNPSAHHTSNMPSDASNTPLTANNPNAGGNVAFLAPPSAMGSPMRMNKPQDMPQPPQRLQQQPSIGMAHPTFRSEFNVNLRQQPPPMKSCLSCHQQIHRNAPICPLCKAKSRSRNPKKPKKKDH